MDLQGSGDEPASFTNESRSDENVSADPDSAKSPSPRIALEPLLVSAPFGNYIRPRGTTPTVGTFTAASRPGRLKQIIKTVRYSRSLRAWVNKIGLRNPGIEWFAARAKSGQEKAARLLVSIHGFDANDWSFLIERAHEIHPLGIELNLSCPNVGEVAWPESLFEDAVATGVPIVAKLPPIRYQAMHEAAAAAGIRVFHCTNTLPVPQGGLSGAPLKPVAIEVVRDLRKRDPGCAIIGGGGIRGPEDVDDYADAGANRFAVATKVFNPGYLISHRGVKPILERARTRATDNPHVTLP